MNLNSTFAGLWSSLSLFVAIMWPSLLNSSPDRRWCSSSSSSCCCCCCCCGFSPNLIIPRHRWANIRHHHHHITSLTRLRTGQGRLKVIVMIDASLKVTGIILTVPVVHTDQRVKVTAHTSRLIRVRTRSNNQVRDGTNWQFFFLINFFGTTGD